MCRCNISQLSNNNELHSNLLSSCCCVVSSITVKLAVLYRQDGSLMAMSDELVCWKVLHWVALEKLALLYAINIAGCQFLLHSLLVHSAAAAIQQLQVPMWVSMSQAYVMVNKRINVTSAVWRKTWNIHRTYQVFVCMYRSRSHLVLHGWGLLPFCHRSNSRTHKCNYSQWHCSIHSTRACIDIISIRISVAHKHYMSSACHADLATRLNSLTSKLGID